MDYEKNRIITQEELDKMGEKLSNCAESLINQQFKKISNDMNYKKKYREALERAKQVRKYSSDLAEIKRMEEIFPELCESEDEKIRKVLVNLVKNNGTSYYIDKIHKDDILAWLEKQGEEKKITHEEVSNANKDEVIRCLINGMKFYYEDNAEATWGTEKFSMKVKDILSWLEKQGGEKPADNVESKFKVGDWITDDEDEVIFHITSYDIDYGYQLETVNGTSFHYSDETIEKKYRLWTIQDAKDGDVLYCDNGNNKTIYLFKEQRGLSNISNTHFQVLNMNNELRLMFNKAADFNLNTKPATKEQRDILFQKMKEAGYEWDTERKEARKIE